MSALDIVHTAAGNKSNFVAKLDTAAVADVGNGITVDTIGNTYITGQANVTTAGYIITAKYNELGVLQWRTGLTIANLLDFGTSIVVDSSGFSYIVGRSSTSNLQIVKYNSTGTVVWQKTLDTSEDSLLGIAIDSDSNIYMVNQSRATTLAYILISKLDSAGNLLLQFYIDTFNISDRGTSIAVDPSGNICITGQANTSTFVAKFNNLGTILWQKVLTDSVGTSFGADIATDASGNIYIVGQSGGTSTSSYIFLIKYLADGTIQWKKKLDTSGAIDAGTSVTIDSDNDIYVTGNINGTTKSIIAKYNSAGTLQWKRVINILVNSIAADIYDSLFVTGTYSNAIFTLKLPQDGKILSSGSWLVAGNTVTYGIATTSTGDITTITETTGTLNTYQLDNKWFISSINETSPSTGDRIKDIVYDSTGNYYVTGMCGNASGSSSAFLLKLDSNGNALWVRTMAGLTNSYGFGLALDSSNNIYCVGGFSQNAAASSSAFFIKFNSAGTQQFYYKYDTANVIDSINSIVIDSSNNIYLTLNTSTRVLLKYSSTGTRIWGRTVNCTGAFQSCLDSFGNIYIAGPSSATVYTAKYNSSGTILWANSSTITSPKVEKVVCDSAGNLYVGCTSGTTTVILQKYATNGTFQWKRSKSVGTMEVSGLAVDSSDNVYFSGQDLINGAGVGSGGFITKFDSTGNALFERYVTLASGQGAGNTRIDNVEVQGGNLLFGMSMSVVTSLVKMPLDGTIISTSLPNTSYALPGYNIVISNRTASYATPTSTETVLTPSDSSSALALSTTTTPTVTTAMLLTVVPRILDNKILPAVSALAAPTPTPTLTSTTLLI